MEPGRLFSSFEFTSPGTPDFELPIRERSLGSRRPRSPVDVQSSRAQEPYILLQTLMLDPPFFPLGQARKFRAQLHKKQKKKRRVNDSFLFPPPKWKCHEVPSQGFFPRKFSTQTWGFYTKEFLLVLRSCTDLSGRSPFIETVKKYMMK